MSRRGRNCRVDTQETVALRTLAFHQTSSPTRYPGFTILTIRPLLCLPPPVELLPRRYSGHAEAKGKYEALPDWMLRERRHGGGNIGDADSSIFSICQALQPRGFVLYGELGRWLYDVVGAFFRQSFKYVHSPRHFCAVGLRRQERDHEKVMRWCSHELARGTRQRGKERSGKRVEEESGDKHKGSESESGWRRVYGGKTQTNMRPRLKGRMALPLPLPPDCPGVKTNWSSGHSLVHTRPRFKARAPSPNVPYSALVRGRRVWLH